MTDSIKEPDAQKKEVKTVKSQDELKKSFIASFSKNESKSSDEETVTDENNEELEENRVPISELRKVRAEAAKYRKLLRKLEKDIEEERKTSELEKVEETDKLRAIASYAEANAEYMKNRADLIAKQAAIINIASSMNFHNPKDAVALLDDTQIEVDEDGNVEDENLREIISSFAEEKPYLIKGNYDIHDKADYGPTNPAPKNWPKPKFRRQDKVTRLKQEAVEAMKNGKTAASIKLYNQAWEMERKDRKK
ncbi:hypothetical protein GF312_02060 [Candidatus Poribacteria bacterium]|nr:hypothetical protein [Candidatus Poribacteria bacterium]